MSVNIFNKSTGSIAQIAGNATGGGGTTITVDNILSATSENPVQNKVITEELNKKADQTTVDSALSLKANSTDVTASLAGKSDTGHTHDDRYYTESETNALLDDKVEISVFDSHVNDTTVHVTAEEKEKWNGKAELTDIPTTLPADGGNADTLDGKHASDFSQIINLGNTSTDTKTAIGIPYQTTTYWCANWTDYPAEAADGQGMIIAAHYNGDGTVGVNEMWVRQLYITPHPNHKIWQRLIVGTTVEEWTNIADGGNAMSANHQIQHRLTDGTDVLTYATSDNCPYNVNTKVRIMHSPTCPTNYGYNAANNDFWYDIYKIDNSWVQIKAYDVRGNVEFINSCCNGTWKGWIRCNDGGNAATVNGLTVQTAVPANAKFTDTTYGEASTSANGLMTTGAQTFAGNKTFNGQVIPAGASAVGTAQARKIYAGTSDMTAGTTALETGAIYLVYE